VAVIRALWDTSVFIARESGRRLDRSRSPRQVGVSVVTVGELRLGVLNSEPSDRDLRLSTLTGALALDPVPVDQAVAEAWARLRSALRRDGKRMPVNDSWIAATALALKVPVVTQDADYDGVPDLDVIRV
jgi:predicted nucleic acid-binding protein